MKNFKVEFDQDISVKQEKGKKLKFLFFSDGKQGLPKEASTPTVFLETLDGKQSIPIEANKKEGTIYVDQIDPGVYKLVGSVEVNSERHIISADAEINIIPLETDEKMLDLFGSFVETFAKKGAENDLQVGLQRTVEEPTKDLVLWNVIDRASQEISFNNYKDYVHDKLCKENRERVELKHISKPLRSYKELRMLTEEFLLARIGTSIAIDYIIAQMEKEPGSGNAEALKKAVEKYFLTAGDIGDPGYVLPYIEQVTDDFDTSTGDGCGDVSFDKKTNPLFLELIWSYWHEEGMLVQSLNAISMRFQNKKSSNKNQLDRLAVDPLRGLNNLIWGYIQDENQRLSMKRRAFEYDHHYGLSLYGKAVGKLKTVDARSKFLEAFHNLVHLAATFYKEYDDTTIFADAFPIRNALREVHLILAEGAHNQYGDLPWTARVEMLMMQYILDRPEMREFLGGRVMVPYEEGWMDRVDTLKKMQGWSSVSVTHFRNLAAWGERILLSIRFGNWNNSAIGAPEAANWATFWRNDIQGYLHAYRAATGIDLTQPNVDFAPPSVHLMRRLKEEHNQAS